jgi:Na+/melibiose symporter-like transporter
MATFDATSEKVPLVTKFAFGVRDVGPATATAIMSFFMLYFPIPR